MNFSPENFMNFLYSNANWSAKVFRSKLFPLRLESEDDVLETKICCFFANFRTVLTADVFLSREASCQSIIDGNRVSAESRNRRRFSLRHPCATSKERRLGHALAIIPRYSKTNCVPSATQKKAENLCVIYQSNYFFIAIPSNPWPDPSSRGSLKFGDKCEMTQQCGFAGSICYQSYCTCSHEFMSTNHVDKCGKGEKVAVMPQV